MNDYSDIINMPHHESAVYNRMPTINRAAQFAPFAALTGYEDAIEETGRITTKRKDIDEYLKAEINEKLNYIVRVKEPVSDVCIIYFKSDLKKNGGKYVQSKGTIQKIDVNKRIIILNDLQIKIEDITSIEF